MTRHYFRSIVPAAFFVSICIAVASAQVPTPSSSPSATTSASNNAVTITQTFSGKVAFFNGTTLEVKLPDGTPKTFTVDVRSLGQVHPEVGQMVSVTTGNGSTKASAITIQP